MKCDSTAGVTCGISLREAVLQGFAPDGGLYLPRELPKISPVQLRKWRGLSFLELSIELGTILFADELSPSAVTSIFEKAFHFPTPFFSFPRQIHCLELFHGPTFSFKDFGARLLAQYLYHLRAAPLTVVVATTGDTGSAVGRAFYGLPGYTVAILYAKGGVTEAQEQQITTIGGNVQAYAVEGTFEACQEMVKGACFDPDTHVTTGNSINLMRLFGQLLYYFYAYNQLEIDQEVIFSVPCGNFGHLVSGILAKRMGLPIKHFIAATNINDEVPAFLHTGIFKPHPAYKTLAVSMDVGNPSNFARLLTLYDHSVEKMRRDLVGVRVTDDEIRDVIGRVDNESGYLLDPHSAIAYHALEMHSEVCPGVFFGTAHPAKFREAYAGVIEREISAPEGLRDAFLRSKSIRIIGGEYSSFRVFLE